MTRRRARSTIALLALLLALAAAAAALALAHTHDQRLDRLERDLSARTAEPLTGPPPEPALTLEEIFE